MDHTPAAIKKNDLDQVRASMKRNDWVTAKLHVQTLLEKQADNFEAWRLKAEIHKHLDDFGTTVSCLNQALKLKPDAEAVCLELAEILELAQKTPLAIKMYEHWLKIIQANVRPVPVQLHEHAAKEMDQWFAKGNALYTERNFHAAIEAYKKVLAISPYIPGALLNLGVSLYQVGLAKEAIEPLMHAIHIKPANDGALNALGTCYMLLGQHARAIAAFQQTVAVNPKHVQGLINTGKSYFILKHYPEAIAAYRKTIAVDPKNSEALAELLHLYHYLCYWDEAQEIAGRVRALIQANGHAEPFITAVHLPDLQLKNATRCVERLYPATTPYNPAFSLPADVRGNGKLRIGYLSSDLQRHATVALIAELFERHDRNRFEVYAYSYGKDEGSEERARVMQSVDTFRDVIALKDPAAANLIREDGIDILIEMKGYTQGTRIGIAAHRPAPVQMHYLGYPGSTGSSAIDYFITDPVASPTGAEKEFSERLIYLPDSYQINDRKRYLPAAALPRHTYGLPEEGFVFCGFNNGYKITPEIFDVWMRLLKAVPGSVLWLHATHNLVGDRLKLETEKRGVDPERVIFAPPIGINQHLARYFYADLFVDTFPVCGHTTASDALWCGVPVVTIAGEPFVSRVAASLLHAVGLPELITNNIEEYEALALRLAQDTGRLATLKKHLNDGRMEFPLFDSMATARQLEAAYLEAARLHRAGQPPKAFSIGRDLIPF
jgi:protein O-GlcNAc transferase